MTVVLHLLVEVHMHIVGIPAQVVTGKVHQHHVLGILFRICQQGFRALFVDGNVARAEGSTRNGVDACMVVCHLAVCLRRRTEDAEASEVEIKQIRRRVDASQRTVHFEIVALERLFETSAEHNLEHIAAQTMPYAFAH